MLNLIKCLKHDDERKMNDLEDMGEIGKRYFELLRSRYNVGLLNQILAGVE